MLNAAGIQLESGILQFRTENWVVARKYFTLLKKTFNINAENNYVKKTKFNKTSIYELSVNDPVDVDRVLSATGIAKDGVFVRNASPIVLKKACCQRAYIRGIFLAGGSLTSPQKGYHLELYLKDMQTAEALIALLLNFDIRAKALLRQSGVSVYIKDSAKIADFLNVTGAVNSFFEYENTKVMKEVRNGVNRLVNCDTANIKKTVQAAQKQIRAIELIEETIGISSLPESLAETARMRMNHPDLKLAELGSMLGVGKSGINHRLRKLEAIAGEIRGDSEEV